jgi:hypothetical protein
LLQWRQYACSSLANHRQNASADRPTPEITTRSSPPTNQHPHRVVDTVMHFVQCRAKLSTGCGRLCAVNHSHVTMPPAGFDAWLLSARDVKHVPGLVLASSTWRTSSHRS